MLVADPGLPASTLALTGCAFDQLIGGPGTGIAEVAGTVDGYPVPQAPAPIRAEVRESWGEPQVVPAGLKGPHAVADTDGPYLLDTGDKLRIFVYGQPNLSRVYTVDHGGMITVPLIGGVKARGLTTFDLEHTILWPARRKIRARSAGHRRHAAEPAILHPRRGQACGAVSLRVRNDC